MYIFGIVPVMTLLAPYKLITGNYIEPNYLVFIYASLASIFIVKILVLIYKRWFKNLPFKILLLSMIMFLMGSVLLWLCVRPCFYEIVIVAGFYFVLQGIFCVFKAIEKDKINYIYLTIACISMALAVGCRPTCLLASILIIPVLYKILKNNIHEKKDILKFILCVRSTVFRYWNFFDDI